MMELKICLEKEFGPILGSRDTVRYLDQKIESANFAILDFEKVEFISRSFSHELWMYIHHSHPEKTLKLANMSHSVKKMWKMVDHQLTAGKSEQKEHPIYFGYHGSSTFHVVQKNYKNIKL